MERKYSSAIKLSVRCVFKPSFSRVAPQFCLLCAGSEVTIFRRVTLLHTVLTHTPVRPSSVYYRIHIVLLCVCRDRVWPSSERRFCPCSFTDTVQRDTGSLTISASAVILVYMSTSEFKPYCMQFREHCLSPHMRRMNPCKLQGSPVLPDPIPRELCKRQII